MKTANLISWEGKANLSVFHSAFHYNIEILKTTQCTHTARAYLHSRSMKHKRSFTPPPSPTPNQNGMLYVLHHSFAPWSMLSVNTKSKNCEERGSFLSKKIKWQHRRAQISPPLMQSLQACQPLEIHIHASPTRLLESVRKREIVANFHRPGDQLPPSGMTGGLEIFFSSYLCNTSSNQRLGSAHEHLHLLWRCDWLNRFHNTMEPLLWDTSIQRTKNLVPEKLPHNFCICYFCWRDASI